MSSTPAQLQACSRGSSSPPPPSCPKRETHVPLSCSRWGVMGPHGTRSRALIRVSLGAVVGAEPPGERSGLWRGPVEQRGVRWSLAGVGVLGGADTGAGRAQPVRDKQNPGLRSVPANRTPTDKRQGGTREDGSRLEARSSPDPRQNWFYTKTSPCTAQSQVPLAHREGRAHPCPTPAPC